MTDPICSVCNQPVVGGERAAIETNFKEGQIVDQRFGHATCLPSWSLPHSTELEIKD